MCVKKVALPNKYIPLNQMKKLILISALIFFTVGCEKKEIDLELKEKCAYAKWRSTKAMPKTNYQEGRMFAHDENGARNVEIISAYSNFYIAFCKD